MQYLLHNCVKKQAYLILRCTNGEKNTGTGKSLPRDI